MAIEPLNIDPLILFPNGKLMGGLMYIKTGANTYEPWDGSVDVEVTSSGSAIEDGVDPDIRATVFDYTNSKPLAVITVDTNGDPTGGAAVSIADGADVVEGELADAKVVGDNAGTVSAKLRGLNYLWALVTDTVNSRLNVFIQNTTLAVTQSGSWVIAAGSAIIGSVTINRTTPGTTNTVAPIAGQDGVAGGTGVDSALTQRVSLATNVPLPAGTNNIGDVDVLSLPALPAGSNTIGKVYGTVADGSTTPDAPITVGGLAKSPDGTDPGNVTEDQVARYIADLNRIQYVNVDDPTKKHANFAESDSVTDEVIVATPGAGYRHIITRLRFSSGDAVDRNIYVDDSDGALLAGDYYTKAEYGVGFMFDCYIPAPANKGLQFNVGGGAGVYTFEIEWITKKV